MIGIGIWPGSVGKPPKIFSPSNIAGLKAWYRADLGVTLNTGKVSGWADQSTTGDSNQNLAQGTAAKRPTQTLSDTSYQGHAVIVFDAAVNQAIASGTFAAALNQPSTMFVVGDMQNAAAGAYFVDGNDGTNRNALFGAGSTTVTAFAGSSLLNTTSVVPANPNVWCVVWNGNSSVIYCSARTAVGSGAAGALGLTGLMVGNRTDGSLGPLTGKIAEIALYTGALSATNINKALLGFGARYNISIGP